MTRPNVILVDTSVWVDHLRAGDERLMALLDASQVLTHPFVIGEIALGHVGRRELTLQSLLDLPQTNVAADAEVLALIESRKLFGLGIGYVDAHLLAAVHLTGGSKFWTRDKGLHNVARDLGIATVPQ